MSVARVSSRGRSRLYREMLMRGPFASFAVCGTAIVKPYCMYRTLPRHLSEPRSVIRQFRFIRDLGFAERARLYCLLVRQAVRFGVNVNSSRSSETRQCSHRLPPSIQVKAANQRLPRIWFTLAHTALLAHGQKKFDLIFSTAGHPRSKFIAFLQDFRTLFTASLLQLRHYHHVY